MTGRSSKREFLMTSLTILGEKVALRTSKFQEELLELKKSLIRLRDTELGLIGSIDGVNVSREGIQ